MRWVVLVLAIAGCGEPSECDKLLEIADDCYCDVEDSGSQSQRAVDTCYSVAVPVGCLDFEDIPRISTGERAPFCGTSNPGGAVTGGCSCIGGW